jgi:hypothetical protein
MGGMGNQMFQYAMILAQARRLGVDFQLDIGGYAESGHRQYQLEQWNIKPQTCSGPLANIFEGDMNYNQSLVNNIKDGDGLCGFWQTEKYFLNVEDEIRRGFIPRLPLDARASAALDEIEAVENSVMVHVRRGDYTQKGTKEYHGLLSEGNYYRDAMHYIMEKVQNPKFFFFSDEPVWVRQNFYVDFSLDSEVIDGVALEAHNIYLMSRCRHAIIANSSFSWWGCWLGDGAADRVVVGPRKWFDQAKKNTSDIMPERWIKI